MGDDNQKDKITIGSLDSITKKLTINSFGRQDKLFIQSDDFFTETVKYGYNALQKLDGVLGNIKINFMGEEDTTSSNIASGFDFI